MHPLCASTLKHNVSYHSHPSNPASKKTYLLPRPPRKTPLQPQQRPADLVPNRGMPLLMVVMCRRHGRSGSSMMVVTAAREEATALDAGSSRTPSHAHPHPHTAASTAVGAGGGGWDGGCVVAGVTA
jgi:hypothetical protein